MTLRDRILLSRRNGETFRDVNGDRQVRRKLIRGSLWWILMRYKLTAVGLCSVKLLWRPVAYCPWRRIDLSVFEICIVCKRQRRGYIKEIRAILPLLPSRSASPHFGRYSFSVSQRVGGWVGLGGWLHARLKTVCHPSTNRPCSVGVDSLSVDLSTDSNSNNHNKPALTRVQRPTPALFLCLVTLTFDLLNLK